MGYSVKCVVVTSYMRDLRDLRVRCIGRRRWMSVGLVMIIQGNTRARDALIK